MQSKSFTTDLYIRKASLVLAGRFPTTSDGTTTQQGGEGNGIDLSTLRFNFQTKAWDHQTYPTLGVRVYNLSTETVNAILARGEYTEVELRAGYQEGWFGTIFRGTIKQFRVGRENPTDTYLDVLAADGDLLNWTWVNASLPPGSTYKQFQNTIDQAVQKQAGIGRGYDILPQDGAVVFENGKVMNGLATPLYDELAYNTNSVWHIWGGQRHMMPNTGVLPGEAIVLNSATGLIGIPEATQEGIKARALLNPAIRPRSLIQINNTDINRVQNPAINGVPSNYADLTGTGTMSFTASTTVDGFYVVLYVEHQGDTHGGPWYTDIVCAAYDSSGAGATSDLGSGYNASTAAPYGSPGGGGPDPTGIP